MISSLLNKVKRWFSPKDVEKPPVIQDEDVKKEILSSAGTSILDSIKVVMATLLSIFVPQYCETTGTTCTLQENFQDLTSFNVFVIAWNFITLGMYSWMLLIQNKRESYFISHLDESRDDAYNSFTENMKEYPTIKRRVKEYNDTLHSYAIVTIILFTLNVLFSGILIFYYFYDGFRSISTMLANVLLVSSKLHFLYNTLNECRQAKMLALSTIHQNPVSYNTVDDAYAIVKENKGRYSVSIKVDAKSVKKMRLQRLRSASVPVDTRK